MPKVRNWIVSIRGYIQKQDLNTLLFLILVVSLLSGVINFRRIAYPTNNDYSLHVLYAQHIIERRFEEIPIINLVHPALQVILIGIHFLTLRNLGLYASLMILQTLAQVLTAIILYLWFGNRKEKHWNWLRAFCAGSLTLVAPIMLLVLKDGLFYFGYIGLASYHNPTIHLLRPVALLSFILALRIFNPSGPSKGEIALAASLMILSALIKPSYALCILPALLSLALIQFLRKRPLRISYLVLGYLLPALVILLAQWALSYWLMAGEQTSIIIMPLQVERAFSDFLGWKFLFSIAFPLTATLFIWKAARRRIDIQLAWLSFFFGAAQLYLLAESGERLYHGNFRWGAQITLFLLFSVAARFVARSLYARKALPIHKAMLLQATYAAHLLAGIAYYLRALISPDYG